MNKKLTDLNAHEAVEREAENEEEEQRELEKKAKKKSLEAEFLRVKHPFEAVFGTELAPLLVDRHKANLGKYEMENKNKLNPLTGATLETPILDDLAREESA